METFEITVFQGLPAEMSYTISRKDIEPRDEIKPHKIIYTVQGDGIKFKMSVSATQEWGYIDKKGVLHDEDLINEIGQNIENEDVDIFHANDADDWYNSTFINDDEN